MRIELVGGTRAGIMSFVEVCADNGLNWWGVDPESFPEAPGAALPAIKPFSRKLDADELADVMTLADACGVAVSVIPEGRPVSRNRRSVGRRVRAISPTSKFFGRVGVVEGFIGKPRPGSPFAEIRFENDKVGTVSTRWLEFVNN